MKCLTLKLHELKNYLTRLAQQVKVTAALTSLRPERTNQLLKAVL